MGTITLQASGTLTSPRYGKASPLDFVRDTAGHNPLYAGYLLGTDFHVGAPSEGSPLTDLSGNGRDLTQTGATSEGVSGMQTTKFLGNNSIYLNTPFTGDNLADSTDGGGVDEQFEIIGFGKFPSASTSRIMFNAQLGSGERGALDATASWDVNLTQFDDVSSTIQTLTNPASAFRDTNNVMIGGAFALDAVQCHKNFGGTASESAVKAVTSSGRASIGGPAMRLFTRSDTNLLTEGIAILFFTRWLTEAERAAVYAGIKASLAQYGVTV